jgi:hypothetical protein
MNPEDLKTISSMVSLILGCTLIGSEFGFNVGMGLYLILITFA